MDFLAKDYTMGHLNALVKLLGCSNVDSILAGKKFKLVVEGLLVLAGKVMTPALRYPFAIKKFFKTRKGLYVWDGFRERILGALRYERVKKLDSVEISYHDLQEPMDDEEIRKELPKKHVFNNPAHFCIYLMYLLVRQWCGGEGPLLTDGCANLFYVRGARKEIVVVGVCRRVASGKWLVLAFDLGGYRWPTGSRVFSRN